MEMGHADYVHGSACCSMADDPDKKDKKDEKDEKLTRRRLDGEHDGISIC